MPGGSFQAAAHGEELMQLGVVSVSLSSEKRQLGQVRKLQFVDQITGKEILKRKRAADYLEGVPVNPES